MSSNSFAEVVDFKVVLALAMNCDGGRWGVDPEVGVLVVEKGLCLVGCLIRGLSGEGVERE